MGQDSVVSHLSQQSLVTGLAVIRPRAQCGTSILQVPNRFSSRAVQHISVFRNLAGRIRRDFLREPTRHSQACKGLEDFDTCS